MSATDHQSTVDKFNAAHAIGSLIEVCPGVINGPADLVRVVKPGAHVLGGHTPVVQVAGGRRGHGCIALTHVRPAAASPLPGLSHAWEMVNALGGTFDPEDRYSAGYDKALADALAEIEKLGGRDPAITE